MTYLPLCELMNEDLLNNISKTIELTATVTPDNAFKGVIWSSSDETKATVDENGVVTGHWSPLTMPLKKERVPTTAVMEFVIDGVSYTQTPTIPNQS